MADKSSLASKLGGTWFGAGLSSRDRERLVAGATLRTFGVGEILLREGAACETFGVLVSGLLGMQTLVPGRGTVTLMTVEPGDVYGWSALVPPHRSTSTVLGIEPGEALVFDAAELRDLLRDDESPGRDPLPATPPVARPTPHRDPLPAPRPVCEGARLRPMVTSAPPGATFLPRERFDALLDLLREGGRTVIGPTLRDGAVMLGEISTAADLPAGWRDVQAPGKYRLSDGNGPRLFDVVNGPQSWKQFTFPPRIPVATARREGDRCPLRPDRA